MLDPFVLLVCMVLALFVVMLIVGTALGIACSQIRATKRRIGRLEQETKRIRQIEERRLMARHNGKGPLYQFMENR